MRTEGFGEKPVVAAASAPTRDDQLAIIEDLRPGPEEHKPPPDDPNFDKVEPHSGIRLRCVFLRPLPEAHALKLSMHI